MHQLLTSTCRWSRQCLFKKVTSDWTLDMNLKLSAHEVCTALFTQASKASISSLQASAPFPWTLHNRLDTISTVFTEMKQSHNRMQSCYWASILQKQKVKRFPLTQAKTIGDQWPQALGLVSKTKVQGSEDTVAITLALALITTDIHLTQVS